MTKAVIQTERELDRWCAFLRGQALPLEVACDPVRAKRTSAHNAYLFGVAYPPIVEATGFEVGGDGRSGGLHEYCCGEFFGWVDRPVPKTPRNPAGIESVPFRTTTRDEHGKRDVVDSATFGRFVETVYMVAAQAGVFIGMSWDEFERDRTTGEIRATGKARANGA